MTIYGCDELRARYNDLGPGDTVVGELSMAHRYAVLLLDLTARGVVCFPSALSQVLSRSKVAQVDILGEFMYPHTLAIRRRKDLLDAISRYTAAGIGPVVTKEEHMHCGHGVRRWDHIETLYSYRGFQKETYPFVLQPLVENFRDLRVILVGDYLEAYERSNPNSFRGNLSSGGACSRFELAPEQERYCQLLMERAQFPYAHLDLQVMPDGQLYVLEIALNGGIQGSRMGRAELDSLKSARIDELVAA